MIPVLIPVSLIVKVAKAIAKAGSKAASKHYNFKQKAMELIEEQGGDYLHVRNVLQSEDYLGRALEDGEKKQLRRYLERRDAAIESEKACASDLPMAQAVPQPMAIAVAFAVPEPNPAVVNSSREIVFPQNAWLELLHQKLLNATNEGIIELFKSMITDDIISVDPMGKSLSGRAAVEEAMVRGLQRVKGNFVVEG